MNNQVLPTGSRVRVIGYGPFRGLKGTIRKVNIIPDLEAGEAFCFYLVELEGAHIKEPIWFECDEVELVDCPSLSDESDLAGELNGEPFRVIAAAPPSFAGLTPVFRETEPEYFERARCATARRASRRRVSESR